MPHRVFITVAEVSGDLHAASLARSLRRVEPDVVIEGLGGAGMRDAGVTVHHETTVRGTFGVSAIFRAREVLQLLKWTRRRWRVQRPNVVVCIDSFAMNSRFAAMAHDMGIAVLYYIPPQLWASREYRVKKLRRSVDHVASILPFEAAWLERRGVKATFVGHPLFDALPPNRVVSEPPPLAGRPPVVGLLAGSRRGEAVGNFPGLLAAADAIKARFPGTRILVPTTGPTDATIRQLAAGRDDLEIGQDRLDTMAPQCDLCLTKSGTSTLHVAAWGVPMIVVYRGSMFLWHIAGRWLVNIRMFALVNLLAGRQIVPEFMPWNGDPRPIAEMAIEMLCHPGKLTSQRRDLLELVGKLDRPGASDNVARLVAELWAKNDAPPAKSAKFQWKNAQDVNR